jgi:hypothetical protein
LLELKRVIGACAKLSRFRPYVELIVSLLPFRFVMKMVGILLSSQGFGSGARVRTSGELNAARILLGDDVTKPMTIFDWCESGRVYLCNIRALSEKSDFRIRTIS